MRNAETAPAKMTNPTTASTIDHVRDSGIRLRRHALTRFDRLRMKREAAAADAVRLASPEFVARRQQAITEAAAQAAAMTKPCRVLTASRR